MGDEIKPLFDPDDPLALIEGEKGKTNKALRDYALMGLGRSLTKLQEKYVTQSIEETQQKPPSKNLDTIKLWSRTFHWQARVQRFDQIQADLELTKWQERKGILREDDWSLGGDLRQKVKEFLDELPKFLKTSEKEIERPGPDGQIERVLVITLGLNTNVTQLAQAGQIASALQRLAANEPTQNIQLHGNVLDLAIERALEDLAHAGQASVSEPNPGPTGGEVPAGAAGSGAPIPDPVVGETPADQGQEQRDSTAL